MISGTVAVFEGYPSGNKASSFSFEGRPKSCLRAGPQFSGVDVKETSPAVCIAARNNPKTQNEIFHITSDILYNSIYKYR